MKLSLLSHLSLKSSCSQNLPSRSLSVDVLNIRFSKTSQVCLGHQEQALKGQHNRVHVTRPKLRQSKLIWNCCSRAAQHPSMWHAGNLINLKTEPEGPSLQNVVAGMLQEAPDDRSVIDCNDMPFASSHPARWSVHSCSRAFASVNRLNLCLGLMHKRCHVDSQLGAPVTC